MEALGRLIYYISCPSPLYLLFCYHTITYFRPLSPSLELLLWAFVWSGCKLFFSFAVHPFYHFQNHFSKVHIQLCYTSTVQSFQCYPNIWHPHPWTQDSLWEVSNSPAHHCGLSDLCHPGPVSHGEYSQLLLFLKSDFSSNEASAWPVYELHFSSLLLSHLYILQSC